MLYFSLANLLLHSSILPPLTPCCETAKLPGSNNVPQLGPSSLPGMLSHLTPDQVHMFLCSLRVSYQSALEFDSRPGLKFLVQKVAQLNNAANLYKQAGAAWTLIALTLFDLCLNRLNHQPKLTTEDVKKCLEDQQKDHHTAKPFAGIPEDDVANDDPQGDDLNTSKIFFVDLHNLFLELCELYVDILVDKDGHHSKLDEMSKQQLYFLTIEPDDFYDLVKKPTSSVSDIDEIKKSRRSSTDSQRSEMSKKSRR